MEWQHLWWATFRTVVALLLALSATRILTKQFVARLTYFDFIIGIMMGALLAHVPNDYTKPFWPVALPVVIRDCCRM